MINKAEILGNLGSDVEMRYTNSGTAVCTMRVATNQVWTDKSGERKESVEWHRVVAWGKLARSCSQHLNKGRQVRVEGQLKTRSYNDKEGIKRYVTEIHARNVLFLGGPRKQQNEQQLPEEPVLDEEAPF